MKYILFLFLLFPVCSSAFDLELGAGQNNYKLIADGSWYQQAYPHTLDLKDVAWTIGVSHKFEGFPLLRAEYVDLGTASADAMSISSDDDYDTNTHTCKSKNPKRCEPIARFQSSGTVKGIALTTAPEWSLGTFSLFVEGGFFIYQPSYNAHVTGMQRIDEGVLLDPYTIKHNMQIEYTYIIGVGVRYKNADFYIRYYGVAASDDDVPALYIGATTAMVRLRF